MNVGLKMHSHKNRCWQTLSVSRVQRQTMSRQIEINWTSVEPIIRDIIPINEIDYISWSTSFDDGETVLPDNIHSSYQQEDEKVVDIIEDISISNVSSSMGVDANSMTNIELSDYLIYFQNIVVSKKLQTRRIKFRNNRVNSESDATIKKFSTCIREKHLVAVLLSSDEVREAFSSIFRYDNVFAIKGSCHCKDKERISVHLASSSSTNYFSLL